MQGNVVFAFAFHIETQQALADKFPGCLSITGDQSAAARKSAIDSFMQNPAKRLIICSLKAAQTAITLTSAHHALFVELDWTPSGLEQAEDRIHRISQTEQVEITYLHAPGSLDDRMLELLKKRDIIKVIIATPATEAVNSEKVFQGQQKTAPFGYRKDGKPRLQAPGPGRRPLSPWEKTSRQKAAKAAWQARNLDYMRDYMRKRRAAVKEQNQHK